MTGRNLRRVLHVHDADFSHVELGALAGLRILPSYARKVYAAAVLFEDILDVNRLFIASDIRIAVAFHQFVYDGPQAIEIEVNTLP